MPKSQPDDFRAAEAGRKTQACYVYIVEHGEDIFHLAAYDEDVVVAGLPAEKGSDPETFRRAQLAHDPVEQRSEVGANRMELTVGINGTGFSARLREMVLYTVPSTIKVTIARVNSASLPGPVAWADDVYVVFKGVATHLAFASGSITVGLVSLLMQSDGKVPRYFYQKTCQHMLGGPLCQVDLDDAAFHLVTAADAAELRGRTVDIPDTELDGSPITAETFQGGKLVESAGLEATITILASSLLPAAAGTRLYLAWWSRTLEAGSAVKVVRGCNRTLRQCDEVFGNKQHFGGFPWIPEISPAVHGVK